MQRQVRVALDSMPLTRASADCRDHSGSQVFALTQAPLVGFSLWSETTRLAAVAARVISTSEGGTRHRFVLRGDLRWSDGERARAADFYEPLARVRNEFP